MGSSWLLPCGCRVPAPGAVLGAAASPLPRDGSTEDSLLHTEQETSLWRQFVSAEGTGVPVMLLS